LKKKQKNYKSHHSPSYSKRKELRSKRFTDSYKVLSYFFRKVEGEYEGFVSHMDDRFDRWIIYKNGDLYNHFTIHQLFGKLPLYKSKIDYLNKVHKVGFYGTIYTGGDSSGNSSDDFDGDY